MVPMMATRMSTPRTEPTMAAASVPLETPNFVPPTSMVSQLPEYGLMVACAPEMRA